MGCVGSDGEDELRGSSSISKRFKVSKKCSDDCIASVDYASVPRKLRSAIKKRRNESISPYLRIPKKKLNHMNEGIGLLRKDGLEKFKKHRIAGGSVSEVVIDPITKDEEEVAETLYALAGMFPETVTENKTPLEGEPSETKSTASPDSDSSRPRLRAVQKEEAGFNRVNVKAPNHSSKFGVSAEEGFRIQSLNDVSQPEKSLRWKLSIELHDQAPKLNLASTVLNSKAEHGIQRSPSSTLVSGDLSRTNKGSGSNIHQPELSLASGENSDRTFKPVAIIGGQHKLLYSASENRRNGSMLWPALSLTETCGSDMQGPSMQSSTSKYQAIFPNKSWFLQPPSLENSVATEKDAQVQVDLNKSWKRCCAHVHISHLIKGLQKTERADILQMQSTQSTTHEGLSRGALITSNNFTQRNDNLHRIASTNSDICYAAERNSSEVRNSALVQKTLLQDLRQASNNSTVCCAAQRNSSKVRHAVLLHNRLVQDPQQACNNSTVCSAAERNSAEVRNAILLQKRLLQDQQGTAKSRLYTLQKQNLEFFPLPVGGARGENTHGAARADTSSGTMAQLHIPYQKSKNHLDIPFLRRHNCYSSSPSISHRGAAAAAQQAQLPPYLGRSSYGPSLVCVTASSKKQAWQQRHHRNDQLAADCKPGQVTAFNMQNWKNEVQNSPLFLHYAQPLFLPSHSSTEVLGSNYTPRQQQPFSPISLSLPPSRVQGQHHQMPYGYQSNAGGHHPKSVPPLQLL